MIKLKPAEALRIAEYLTRVIPLPAEQRELVALIKRLQGGRS